jgi:hypothetical protein
VTFSVLRHWLVTKVQPTFALFLDKLTMQLSHLSHVLLGISHTTVLALILQNSTKVSMGWCKAPVLRGCSEGTATRSHRIPGGESRFGYVVRQTQSHLKAAIFNIDHTSFIATNVAIEYISISTELRLVLT